MLYYPLLDCIRQLIFFIPIGAGEELYYVSFGGAIVSQLFITMSDISCPYFLNRRDKIVRPFTNFLLLGIELSIISIGLAQSVSHPEVSRICEIVMFGIASALFSVAVIALIPDAAEGVRRRFSNNRSEEILEEESEVVMVKTKKTKRKGKRKGETISPLNKKMKKNEVSDDEE